MLTSPLRQALGAHLGQVLTPEIAAAIEVAAESTQPVPWEKSTRTSLIELMSGNEDAADLVAMVADWSHVYDDLIDKDKPVADTQIHRAMWTLLAGLLVWRDHANTTHTFPNMGALEIKLSEVVAQIAQRGTELYMWNWAVKAHCATLLSAQEIRDYLLSEGVTV